MKGIFWNSRGLLDLAKYRYISEALRDHNLDFLAIMETEKNDIALDISFIIEGEKRNFTSGQRQGIQENSFLTTDFLESEPRDISPFLATILEQLPSFLSSTQSAFIKGRNILEGVVILHETLHLFAFEQASGLKINFHKSEVFLTIHITLWMDWAKTCQMGYF
ncbi:hypothetical protein ACJX0J_007836, partial [Zea mays]